MKTAVLEIKNRAPEQRIRPGVPRTKTYRWWLEFRLEMELIGARLRRLRLDKGYSIAYAAGKTGMPKYRLYRIEQGTYVHFSKRDLRRLCACYGTTSLEVLSIFPDDLFEDMIY